MKNGPTYSLLIKELKNILKKKGIKYSQLADQLKMSESSVKRLMTAVDGPFSKIEAICEVAGLSFFDLVAFCKEERAINFVLTAEQERFFSHNTHYFYFFHLLHEENFTIKQIMERYQLNQHSISQYLKKLEELGLLERHPGDKVKILGEGRITFSEINDLGRSLIKSSMHNFAEVTSNFDELKRKAAGKELHFAFGEYYMRHETADHFIQDLRKIEAQMDVASSREVKVYEPHELDFYTSVVSFLPMRFYYEDLPNL